MSLKTLFLGGVVFLGVVAGAWGDGAKGATGLPAGLPGLIREFEADANSVGSFYDMPWAGGRFDRLERLFKEWRIRLDAVDFESLDVAGKVDAVLLRNQLEESLGGVERDRRRLKEMDPLVGFRAAVEGLEEARWRGDAMDVRAVAEQLDGIAKQIKDIRDRIEEGRKKPEDRRDRTADSGKKGEPDRTAAVEPLEASPALALRASRAVSSLAGTLKRWYEFHNGYQPEFTWWVRTPYEGTAKQFDEYAKFLREEIAGQRGKDEDPLVGDPIGADALARAIRFEFLPYTAEELIAIGERELAWCEKEMKAAARKMGFGDDWRAAMDKVKSNFVPPGRQDALVSDIAREAADFVRKHDFATVEPLCEETWRLSMIPPDGLKSIPYAAYSGREMMVAYAREDMKQGDKLMVMRGNNRHFTRLTTPHELIPGHHLQIFTAARHNPHRSMFRTPFYVEGWALYVERRLWDLGWAKTPEDRLGMLFWRANRAARVIVTLKFHLGRMKPDEMVRFLIERVGHEKFGATSEVRRFVGEGFSPLYQVSYLVGGLQLQALRDELVKRGRWSERDFNDAVLRANTMPIELLRALLLDRPPPRDARPAWRFADPLD